MRRIALLAALAALPLSAATAADVTAQVEARDTLGNNVVLSFAFGAGTPDLPHTGTIDLEFRSPDRRLFPSLGVASPGDYALVGVWLNRPAWQTPPDGPASGFFGLGPTFEFGNGGIRLAAAARTGAEYRIARGLRLRFEGRGLLFMAGASAGDGAVIGLIGLSAGGHL